MPIGLAAGLGTAPAGGGGGGGGGTVTTDGATIVGDGDATPLAVGVIGTAKLGGNITAAGKALLDDANATAQRATLGLGTAAVANDDAFEPAGAVAALAATLGSAAAENVAAFDAAGAAAAVAASLAAVATSGSASDLGAGTLPAARLPAIGTAQLGGDVTAAGKALLDDATVADQRTTLGLHAIATSGSAADLGAGTLPAARIGAGDITTAKLGGDITAAGKALLDDADAAAQRATLGLAAIAASGSAADLGAGTIAAARFADNTIALARLANLAAGKIVGSVAGGAASELSPGQIFDLVSATTGAILTRTGANTWAAAAKASIDVDGDLLIATNATPTTPAAGKVKLFAMDIAGRLMPAFVNVAGFLNPLQTSLGARSVHLWKAAPGTTTPTLVGLGSSTTGTATSHNPAATNYATMQPQVRYVTGTGAGSVAGPRQATTFLVRGDAAGVGGFAFTTRWLISDAVLVTDARTFVGVRGSAAPTDVEASAVGNTIGFGHDAADTTLHVMHNDASGVATKINLGANFPINTTNTDVYECSLYCPPNAAFVSYRVVRLNTGHVATGTITTELPANTTMLTYNFYRSNNTTAAAAALSVCHIYIEAP